MKRILSGLALALLTGSALAADNAIVVTPGAGVTVRSVDVGAGVQSPMTQIGNSAGTNIVGAGTTLPVSGTVTATGTVAATQSGAWTVNPTTPASWSLAATAAAVPANATYIGMNVGGNLVGLTGTGTSLNVICTSGCAGAGGTSSSFGAAFPSTGTAIGGSDASSVMHSFGLAQLNVAPTAGQWALVTSNTAPVAASFIDGWDATQGAKADSVCGTATGTCSQIALLKFLNTAVTGPIAAGTNLIGVTNIAAATTGGCTPAHYYMAGASANAINVKNAAGTLCELTVINTSTTGGYFRLYDLSATPTCSSATGAIAAYPIQSNATSPGLTINLGSFGKAFQNGIGFCFTNAVGDADATNWAGTTNNVVVNMSYK